MKEHSNFRKAYFVLIIVLTMIFSFSVCGSAGAVVKMNVAHVLSDTHPCHLALVEFAKAVKVETKNQVQIEVISGGALGSERDEMEQVKMGALAMSLLYGISNFQGMEPVCAIEELPFMWETRKDAYAAFDGELGNKISERIERHGFKVLAYWENGFRNFTNNVRPISKPEDMKGIKFRVAESAIRLDTFRALEASAVPMPFPELFTALQQGTVDGQENPISIIYTSRFYEVQKYLSLSGHIWNSAILIINPSQWKKLSENERNAIQDNAMKYRIMARENIQRQDDELIKELRNKGMEITEVDKKAFQKAVQPVWDKYEKKFGKEFMDLVKKYSGR